MRTSPLEALCDHLRGRRMLLVLDNFEHVMGAASEVAVMIQSCTNLTALVTSRSPLRVRGEQEYPVSPLALPSSTRSPAPEEVAASPSGRLFLQRARSSSPTFELTESNAGAVASICWRLDGLPLALELAAARTRFLNPQSLLGRLDRALEAGGARDLPPRQQTMRSTLDWSHHLLSEGEQVLFRRLSVFSGGFTLEAAEAVGGVADALDFLGRLVEQSLVLAEASSGEMRYRMLEPVRQYAKELLEESLEEAGEIRRRHALYYLALGERVGLELKGPEQPARLGLLETELGNLRTAIRWSIDHGETDALARTAWAMWKFWWLRGHRDESRLRMEEALVR
ncbi:MAG: ATP-binding protein, partial [Rubrobacter sp.]